MVVRGKVIVMLLKEMLVLVGRVMVAFVTLPLTFVGRVLVVCVVLVVTFVVRVETNGDVVITLDMVLALAVDCIVLDLLLCVVVLSGSANNLMSYS